LISKASVELAFGASIWVKLPPVSRKAVGRAIGRTRLEPLEGAVGEGGFKA
jgi:hypothetical protein